MYTPKHDDARSHDLNPLDYGIWGILKAKVYSIRPQTLLHLKTRLDQEVASPGANQGLLREPFIYVLAEFVR